MQPKSVSKNAQFDKINQSLKKSGGTAIKDNYVEEGNTYGENFTKVNKFSSHQVLKDTNERIQTEEHRLAESKDDLSSINDIIDRDENKQKQATYLPNIHQSRAI
mmetsp:Transcript_8372/g.6241  ORF Transcript_8372/g.6241 Transcript_8372/m.6241 type:complete len:105 (+) Transcript_8372:488-802(+)|eukprot:CAMPEP_0202978370 /NCGR_PEP_ID=MMETSP1396-20130829/84817_1 /ASSEMBLY_ACC=CAM_ASM_000872 /TAXON_ID= /ORGANISM="Pseudokeronopsis sp., Strain Brazil" /LENGTH=104 /DNA_ID=CAMNT_0049717319 /DNA_START=1624 /DNA_END=1938 /DNA_ORIENTATION=-